MNCTIVGIAGGTGSGKSTFTNRIKEKFEENVTVIYLDDYYCSHNDLSLKDRSKINYDHPDAFEIDLLLKHLSELNKGKSIECPIYNYITHNRLNQTKTIIPNKILIIEGILVFSDIRLREMFDIKIYVESDSDERILRRILRDVKERSRTIESIVEQYLTTVKPMHYLYVEPTKVYADLIVNGGLNGVAFDVVTTKLLSLLERNI